MSLVKKPQLAGREAVSNGRRQRRDGPGTVKGHERSRAAQAKPGYRASSAFATMLQKTQAVKVIFGAYFRVAGLKSMLLKYGDLIDFPWFHEGLEKGGAPNFGGKSHDVIENKGRVKTGLVLCHDLAENTRVTWVSTIL